MTKKESKTRQAAKVIVAFLATVAKNPVVFNTPEFDRRRRRQGHK